MKRKNRTPFSFAIFLVLIALLVYGLRSVSERSTIDSAIAMERNIRKAAVACYATEGAYPQDLDYLIENYGLLVDATTYVIRYESIGSNIMPSIAVVPKGTYDFENDWSNQ